MKPRTRQRVVFVASVVALFLFGTSPTQAILNGTLDVNRHPNVGAVVAEVGGVRFSPCSGILIAPTVLVGAAHCLDFLEDVGATQVWVTFDSEANVETSQLIPGTMHPNPAFEANAPDPNDVAVITFDTPVVGIVPAVLPTLGLLDELRETNGLKDQLFTVVGYGAHQRIVGEGPQTFLFDLKRRFATSELNALEPALLRLAMNASRDLGGASFGDSGGPIFRNDSNPVVAIVGLRSSQGMYMGYRLDIPSAQAFLSPFVTLPN